MNRGLKKWLRGLCFPKSFRETRVGQFHWFFVSVVPTSLSLYRASRRVLVPLVLGQLLRWQFVQSSDFSVVLRVAPYLSEHQARRHLAQDFGAHRFSHQAKPAAAVSHAQSVAIPLPVECVAPLASRRTQTKQTRQLQSLRVQQYVWHCDVYA